MSLSNLEAGRQSGSEFIVGRRIPAPIPDFVPKGFKPTFSDELIRARVSTAMMHENNPLFRNEPGVHPTGIELYLIGSMSMQEAVRYLADQGIKDEVSLAREFGSNGDFAVRRADELLDTGVLSSNSQQSINDLRILVFEDVSAGAIIARLRGQMSDEARNFRDTTHSLVGDPRSKYFPPKENGPRQAEIVLPNDYRRIGDHSLGQIIDELNYRERRGWDRMQRLFRGQIKGPHARMTLQQLRPLLW